MFHVLSTNKKAEQQFRYNEHLIKQYNALRKSINLSNFDVTLLIAVIKNVNRTNCFNNFRITCNNATCTYCTDCSVKYAVEEARKLRNTSAHETDYQLDEFLNGNHEFHDFKGLGTYEILMQHFKEQFHILHTYLKDRSKFPQSNVFGKQGCIL